MPTIEERLAALETKMAQLTATTPTTYYTHKYSGEEIDDAVDKIRSGAGEGAVRYDQAQTLTPDQQKQAQHNIGTTWPCNPNLLDNWHFQIWQRYSNGSYSGVPNGIYVADRWIITSSNGSVSTKLIKSTPYGGLSNSVGPNCRITQRLENAAQYNKMTLTLSVLKNKGLYSKTIVASKWDNSTDIFAKFSSAVSWLNAGETILAAKLELGSTQTLAHREGNKWVLNEVPDYGEQLRRCQRYAIDLHGPTNYGVLGSGVAKRTDLASIFCPLPVSMRVTPVATFGGSLTLASDADAGRGHVVTAVKVDHINSNGITLNVDTAGLTISTVYQLWRKGDASAHILLSADL